MNIPQHLAQATNLIFFIPTSITAIIINIKNKNINLKISRNIIIFGIIGAIIGAIISNHMEVQKLRKLFGGFLLIISIYEIYNFYNQYIKNKNTNNKFEYKNKEVDKNEIG